MALSFIASQKRWVRKKIPRHFAPLAWVNTSLFEPLKSDIYARSTVSLGRKFCFADDNCNANWLRHAEIPDLSYWTRLSRLVPFLCGTTSVMGVIKHKAIIHWFWLTSRHLLLGWSYRLLLAKAVSRRGAGLWVIFSIFGCGFSLSSERASNKIEWTPVFGSSQHPVCKQE